MEENKVNGKNTTEIQTNFGEYFNLDKVQPNTTEKTNKQTQRKEKQKAATEEAKNWVVLGEILIRGISDNLLENAKGKGNYESFRLDSAQKKTLTRHLARVFLHYQKNKPHPVLLLFVAVVMIYSRPLFNNFAADKLVKGRKPKRPTNEPNQPIETTPNPKELENNAEIERLKKELELKNKELELERNANEKLRKNNQSISARYAGVSRRIKTAEKRELEKAEQSETIRTESEQSEKP